MALWSYMVAAVLLLARCSSCIELIRYRRSTRTDITWRQQQAQVVAAAVCSRQAGCGRQAQDHSRQQNPDHSRAGITSQAGSSRQ